MRQGKMGFGGTVASAGPYANNLHLAPESRQITTPTPHHSIFYRPDALLTSNQQCQSTEGKKGEIKEENKKKGNKERRGGMRGRREGNIGKWKGNGRAREDNGRGGEEKEGTRLAGREGNGRAHENEPVVFHSSLIGIYCHRCVAKCYQNAVLPNVKFFRLLCALHLC